ncbi:MAG TPA: TolC family protein [Bryobacteraceae bacterium]|nr:TolC family protein [Bryobacteraceae bacterium]
MKHMLWRALRTARPVVWLGFVLVAGRAQSPLTLEQAVDQAMTKYPAVRASLQQVSAAAAGINLARTSYLPRADFLGQVNRGTHNNVFGLMLPQSVISPISGPVLRTNSLDSVWGSAVGLLVSWEPFDFGLRHANVEVARSARDSVSAQVAVTSLEAGTAAADAYLTIAAAQQTVLAARAGVERARVLNQVIETLAKNELRPGADASRSRAELALAETQLIQAEQAADVGRAALAQVLGVPPGTITIEPGPLVKAPPEAENTARPIAQHPMAIAQNAAIEEVKAREKALDRSYFPRFNLQGTSYARGTGIDPLGVTGGALSGLGPNIQNWAVGMSITFPAFDLPSIRARKQIEHFHELAESARYDQVLQDLNGQVEKARATLAGARRVAKNTPIELDAARASEQQATARYKAGLATVVEVAEAQRILTQAEIDDALARLNIWRAMLALSAAEGDLAPYLDEVRRAR